MASAAGEAAESKAGIGQYGPLTLYVKDGTVTGTFFEQRGETNRPPLFSCIFILKGRLEGTKARVATWLPGDTTSIPGVLTVGGNDVSLSLKREQAGCATATGNDMVSTPFEETLTESGDSWAGVAMIAAKHVVVQSTPALSAKRRPYLVRFDPVVILERKQDWVKVSYLSGMAPVTGWLRQSELAPDDPPPAE